MIVRNVATGVQTETISSTAGNYVIPNLPVGSYELSVSATGFKSWSRAGIALSSNDNLTRNGSQASLGPRRPGRQHRKQETETGERFHSH